MPECMNCREEVERVIPAPLLRVAADMFPGYESGEPSVRWHVPGQSMPGAEEFNVIREDGDDLLIRPWDACDGAMCVACWAGQVWPACYPYLDNKPPAVKLDGWRQATWAEEALTREG